MRGTTLSTAMLFYGSKDLNFGNKWVNSQKCKTSFPEVLQKQVIVL